MKTTNQKLCIECWGEKEVIVDYPDAVTGEHRQEVLPCVCLLDDNE